MNWFAAFVIGTLLTLLSIWAYNRFSGSNVASLGTSKPDCGC